MKSALTREQIRRIDRLAIERYKIPGLVLMENAGRSAAAIICDAYGSAGRALICCGTGNNGGDGCVIARHLHNTGWTVRLMIAGELARMTPDAKANYAIVKAMNLNVSIAPDAETQGRLAASVGGSEIVIDALLGTGFSGEVRSPTAELIQALNKSARRAMIAVDVPSGLDCNTGVPSNATIRADVTITFVAAKSGFQAESAAAYLGRVEVADIGAPHELLGEVLASPD
jgi:NAD(P)H-hydrate epimerase